MKIIALRIEPIARVSAFLYSVLGFFFWLTFCFSNVDYITLPVGVIAPLLNLNVNLHLHRSPSIFLNVLFLVGSIMSYAATGWITAAVAVLCFNAIAKWKRGIKADFVVTQRDEKLIAKF